MMLLWISFCSGILAVLIIEALVLYLWFKRQPVTHSLPDKVSSPLSWNDIADTLKKIETASYEKDDSKCDATAFLNVIMLFLFQELRDDSNVRAQVLSRLNVEINEILESKFNSRIIKTLCVHNFSIGTSPPKVTNVQISKLKMCNQTMLLRKLHMSVDLEYTGCGKLALQATTFLGKNVYLSVEVSKLIGKLIFIFNRDPQTHWGFCFDTEPEVEFNIISSFQMRRLPKLTKVVTSILKHTIRKKHTKPQYKHRYSPLFPDPPVSIPLEQQLLVLKEPLSSGKMVVNLISANRIIKISDKLDGMFYCTLSLGTKQCNVNCCPLNQNVEFDAIIENTEGGIGFNFTVESNADHSEVVVGDIQKNSPASFCNIKHGDTITAINDKKVNNFRTALTQSLSAKYAKMSIKRPMVRWNKLFASAEASQDMEAFQNDDAREPRFVEDEEFLILKELEENENLNAEPTMAESLRSSDCIGCQSGELRHDSTCLLRTSYIPVSVSPEWDEYFVFKLKETHNFLNICLWKESSNRVGNPILVGHYSSNLADLVLQCISTLDNTYIDTIVLSVPTDLKWQENIVPPVGSLPHVLPKMKYVAGEVKLQLTHCFEGKKSCVHHFVEGQTQTCEHCCVCSRPIVHRSVLLCSLCGVVKHEKCSNTSMKDHQLSSRRSTGVTKKHLKTYNVNFRKRFNTVHAPRATPSSNVMKGATAATDEIDVLLRKKIAERKFLLDEKARYEQVPQKLIDQLSLNEESIKEIITNKEKS